MSGHVFVILCEIYQIITEIFFQMCFLVCCLDLKKWLQFPCIYLGLKGCLELNKWMDEWMNESINLLLQPVMISYQNLSLILWAFIT